MNCPGKILRVYSPTGWQTTSEDGVFLPTSVARAGFKISMVRLLFWNLEIAKKENKLKKGFRIFTQNHQQELQNEPPLLAPLGWHWLTFKTWSGLGLLQVGWKFAGKKACPFSFLEFVLDNLQKMWGGFVTDAFTRNQIEVVETPQTWGKINPPYWSKI